MSTTTETQVKLKCLGADCENEAGSLQCPTCLKMSIKDSFFCSQDCFKRNWVRIAPLALGLIRLPPSTNHGLRPATDSASSSRATTRPCTKLLRVKQRMVFLTTSELLRSFLNPIQPQVFTIRSPPSPTPDLCGPSIRCQKGAPFRKTFHGQTTQRPATQRARCT